MQLQQSVKWQQYKIKQRPAVSVADSRTVCLWHPEHSSSASTTLEISFSKPMSNNLHFTITIESVTSSWTLQHTSTNHEISTGMHTHIVQQLIKAVSTAEVAYTAFYGYIKQHFFNSQFLGQPGWVGNRLSNRHFFCSMKIMEMAAVRCSSCHSTNTVKYRRHINPWKQYSPRLTWW